MSDSSGSRPAPSATGTLASTPFAHVLVYARNKRLTGTLELRAPDGRSGAIAFWRGRIFRVETSPMTFSFGSVVLDLGLIDDATLQATLPEVTGKRPHGELLVERGLITAAQRDAALVEQSCRRVHHLFSLPTTTGYAFYDERAGVNEPPRILETLAPVWRGLRDDPPTRVLQEALARYATTPLRMVNEGALHRVDFGPEEKEVIRALSLRPLTLPEMRAVSTASPKTVDLLAYLLLVAKCVEPLSTSNTSMPAVTGAPPERSPMPSRGPTPTPPAPSTMNRDGSGAAPRTATAPGFASSGEVRIGAPTFRIPSSAAVAAPPAKISDAPKAVVASPVAPAELGPEGIVARAKGIAKEGYFEMLGVPPGSAAEVVRGAYLRLAKTWHPDRLPKELAGVRSEVMTVFTHFTRAHETLTNEEARRTYLAERAAATAKLGARPRADVLRDIDAALLRRDFLGAEGPARKLHEASAEDAEALAILAWTASLAGQAPDPVLRSGLAILERAIAADTACERAYFYRGTIHKRLGNAPAALRDFERVVVLNPSRSDAEREVRILGARARPSGEVKVTPSLAPPATSGAGAAAAQKPKK
jgi:hypothetical protein